MESQPPSCGQAVQMPKITEEERKEESSEESVEEESEEENQEKESEGKDSDFAKPKASRRRRPLQMAAKKQPSKKKPFQPADKAPQPEDAFEAITHHTP